MRKLGYNKGHVREIKGDIFCKGGSHIAKGEEYVVNMMCKEDAERLQETMGRGIWGCLPEVGVSKLRGDL